MSWIDFILFLISIFYLLIIFLSFSSTFTSFTSLTSQSSSSIFSSSLTSSSSSFFSSDIHIFIAAITGSITSVAILQITKLFSHSYLGIAKSGNSVNIMKINIFLSFISATSGLLLTCFGKGNPAPDYFG